MESLRALEAERPDLAVVKKNTANCDIVHPIYAKDGYQQHSSYLAIVNASLAIATLV